MDFLSEPWDISEETDRLNQKLFGSSLSPLSKINVKRQKVKTKGRMERRADNHSECESSDMSKRKSERKGKKRTLESVSSYEKSKRKKIIGKTLESESNTEEHSNNFDSNTVRKKKKKNKKNKFKLDNTDNVTRQPGGKNFQRRETKKDSIRSAAEEALTKDRRPEENVAQVTVEEGTSRHEKTNNKTVVRGKDNQVSESVKRDKSGKENGNFRKSLKKVKGEKKKKSKAKSDTNSANKSDGSVHSANNSLSEISNDGKKKTFNPAILASMLASVSKSETTRKKEDVQNKRTEVDTEPRKNKSKKQKKTEMEDEATSKLEKTPSQPLSLKEKLMEQLNSARFRYINEQLYTQTGEEAQEMFAEDEEAFKVYHQGFQTQVNKWPINPVDILIKDIRQLPRNKVIADFGCGDAKIARNVSQKVHSFDLVALNDHVTACDMAHVPLGDASVDVAVFCLSLMGTNLSDYLIEAYRVLKTGGQLKIAEVASRFQNLPQFLLKIDQFGFHQESKDTSNKMFYLFNLKKKGKPKGKAPQLTLEPCVYKKR